MAFNFKQYTSNNPLLQEINDDPTVSNIDAYAETGGLEENKFPLLGIENAVLAAIEAGIDKQTVINIVNQTYGGSNKEEDYISSKEFDYMDNNQLDAAGLTGDKIGPEN